MKKKTLALMMAMAVVFGVTVAGTLAWLTDSTEAVVNTFTTSDVTIKLEETNNPKLVMVPGKTIAKDPKVTVVKDSEDCYVFVKIDKSTNYDNFLTDYVLESGWTAIGAGAPGVYYRIVSRSDADQPFQVLKDNQVKVLDTVTKTAMKNLVSGEYPTLTFTAYAIQKNHLNTSDILEIWKLASATP